MLRWCRVAAAHVDFQSLARQQKQQWMETWIDLFKRMLPRGMKNRKGFGVYL
jgi:hypothetical protein